ncbi:MAG: CHASE domain-containing protein [Pseudomonadota bacterium]
MAQAHVGETTAGGATFTRASRLSALHWSVLCVALVVTVTASWLSRQEAQANAENQFVGAAERIVQQVQFRMAKYETAMRAGVAAIHATPVRPTRGQWKAFASRLAIDETYPGIAGIGLSLAIDRSQLESHILEFAVDRPEYRPYPNHNRELLFPIVFVEPEARNSVAIGLDLAHEPRRFRAAQQARSTGQTQITAPIQLVADQPGQAGFLLLTPFFNRDIMSKWDASEGDLLGFVCAPFNIDELLVGVLGQESRNVAIRLSDSDEILFDEWSDNPTKAEQTTSISIPIFGRQWQFDFRSDDYAAATQTSTAILALGLAIDGILLLMFVSMARVNRRAVAHIEAVNMAHHSLSSALSEANAQLGEFAHAASQQLRAPLRGIVGLTEWIREDIAAVPQIQVTNQLLPTLEHVDTIRKRARRMDSLIHGILCYAEVGSQPQAPEAVKATALCDASCENIDLPDGALIINSEVETLKIDQSRIIQVLRELIDNSLRHHDNIDPLRIELRITEDELHYEFMLSDNGPGIEATHVEAAFQSFTSLRPPEDTRMSGLGLTLAKKITESVGGSISITNAQTRGTRVIVRWPKPVLTEDREAAA